MRGSRNGQEWMEDLIGLEGSYVTVLVLKVIENMIKVKTSKNGIGRVFIMDLNYCKKTFLVRLLF